MAIGFDVAKWKVVVLTDARLSMGRSHAEVIRAAIAGGADAIQLRDKEASGRSFFDTAVALRRLCRDADVPFIVNDRIDIALAAAADGAHVGQNDLPASEARRLLGPDHILGVSASTVEEARAAADDGADYIGAGPVFDARSSKPDASRPIGIEGIKSIAASVPLPVIGIGGVTLMNASQVVAAGAVGVAVISAVVAAHDIADAVRALKVVVLHV